MKIKSHIMSAVAVISLGLAGLTSTQAAVLTVAPGDITGGQYNFVIGGTSGNPLSGYDWSSTTGPGLVSNTNFQYNNESGTEYLWAITPGGTASLTLGWDFSTSGYYPTSVDLTSISVGFGGTGSWTLSTSTDGVTFTPYATYSDFLNPNPTQTVAITGSPATFYYKVEVAGVGAALQTQWGRNIDPDSFTASFTVVPEPATWTLLVLGAIAVMTFRRRRPDGGTENAKSIENLG